MSIIATIIDGYIDGRKFFFFMSIKSDYKTIGVHDANDFFL